jgi:hypothetical protein
MDIGAATAASYTLTASDVGSTLRVVVTASNGSGSTAATSGATGVVTAAGGGVPAGFDSVVADPGCAVTVTAAGELQATIQGGPDGVDSAYGVKEFGGANGLAGTVYVRDLLRLGSGQVPTANVAVFQVKDKNGALVYELYVSPDRVLHLWSPAGGLAATSINDTTGVTVPNDGTSIRVEVAAQANGSLTIRVNDTPRLTLGNLTGATTSGQRTLTAGIDHYDSPNPNEPLTTTHGSVTWTQTGWPGAPGGGGSSPQD